LGLLLFYFILGNSYRNTKLLILFSRIVEEDDCSGW